MLRSQDRCYGRLAPSHRRGWTLVELLVTLAILSILASFIVPAIQSVREASRQTTCSSHIKQIATACESFEATRGTYPYSQLFGDHGKGPDSTAWSFLAQILPHLEQKNLYDAGGIPDNTIAESGIADSTIDVFLCPSDPDSTAGPRFDAGNMVEHDFPVGRLNYKGVCGSNWGADETQNWGPDDSGTFWKHEGTNGSYDGLNHGDGILTRVDYRKPRRKAEVVDGVSHTFLLGEAVGLFDIYCSWPYANNVHSTCAIPPNHFTNPDPRDWPNAQSFRSLHPGGLHFVTADSTTRFVNQSIDLTVYRGLATIHGGEVDAMP